MADYNEHKLSRHIEGRLAKVLSYGTWLAWATILFGEALSALTNCKTVGYGSTFVTGGIALFILLPVITVAMLLIAFVGDRDVRFSAVTTVVLILLLLSFFLGIYIARDRDPAHHDQVKTFLQVRNSFQRSKDGFLLE